MKTLITIAMLVVLAGCTASMPKVPTLSGNPEVVCDVPRDQLQSRMMRGYGLAYGDVEEGPWRKTAGGDGFHQLSRDSKDWLYKCRVWSNPLSLAVKGQLCSTKDERHFHLVKESEDRTRITGTAWVRYFGDLLPARDGDYEIHDAMQKMMLSLDQSCSI